jgi:hypothetical protein
MDGDAEGIRLPMVGVGFVDVDFFLDRIREFECKYSTPWQQFVAEYSAGKWSGGCENADFAEWNFLCNNFTVELLRPLDTGPPVEEHTIEGQKPESISGFLLFWGNIVRSVAICQKRRRYLVDEPSVGYGRKRPVQSARWFLGHLDNYRLETIDHVHDGTRTGSI